MYLVQHVSFVAYVSTHNFNQEGNNGGKDTLYCTVDTERISNSFGHGITNGQKQGQKLDKRKK